MSDSFVGLGIDRTDAFDERQDKLKQKSKFVEGSNANIYIDDPHHRNKQPVGSGLNTDQWAVIKDQYIISPIYGGNGRVLVQEDPFKSKFDCSTCGGQKHLGVVCPRCNGTKHVKEEDCWECAVDSEYTSGSTASKKSIGFVPCSECNGKGGLIVIPEENQRNTTTGQVLAISDREILEVKVGDKVMFTNYSGSPFKFLDVDLRIIIERDLLGKVKQLKKNVDGLNEGTFAELENTGTPRE
jgi:co-chaperonin GroES (HSP10)